MSTLKNFFAAGLCSATLMCAMSASASVVTVGNLSSDTETQITTDTTSGRSYTRFDAFNLSYDNTLLAITPGGAWAGWSIATAAVSDDFIAAALGVTSTPCTGAVNFGTQCGTIGGWSDGQLGASYMFSYDYYAYLNSYGGAGLAEFRSFGEVADYEDWYLVTGPDMYKGASAINYLLFKEATAVPEPVSLAVFGLGLVGLGLARRRQRR